MKKMILCADDYGQNTAISTGIRKLVTKQRLTAVSCMVNMPDWESDAAKLQEHQSHIDIGLHFNLTEGTALHTGQPHPSHKKLMWQAFSGQLSQEAIEAELEAQLRQFKVGIKTNPMFIDGHQHIQHLPVIRDALVAVINNHFPQAPPYIRLCAAPSFAISRKRADMHKQWIIHFTGVNQFKKILDASGIPHNATFAGIYSFKPTPPYRSVFQQFLATLQDNSIVMCHPGDASDADDALKISRPLELGYIESENFTQDLLTHNIKLCRFQELT